MAPLLHNDEILGVLWLDSETLAQFQPKDLEIVTSIAAQAAMFIEINILGSKIEQEIINRERFSRLLSPNVAERVLSGELEVKKGGQLVEECTVFNSDIRGFTRMSEGAPPESIVEMLNEYFEQMVETLFKYEGTLDKFMGDGIMALWGAPVAHPDDADALRSCAIEQMDVLGSFNRRRMEDERTRRWPSASASTPGRWSPATSAARKRSPTRSSATPRTPVRACAASPPQGKSSSARPRSRACRASSSTRSCRRPSSRARRSPSASSTSRSSAPARRSRPAVETG